MWLLLVAVGSGYLARCWQRARRFKSDPCFVQQNAGFGLSHTSPSCTPKRGRPSTSSRRGFRGRSQSAKGASRKVSRRRRDGRSIRSSLADDEVVDSAEKLFGELVPIGEPLCRAKNQEISREDMEGHVPVVPTCLLPPVFAMGFLNNKLRTIIMASESRLNPLDVTHTAWLPGPHKEEPLHPISFPPACSLSSTFKLPKIVPKQKDGKQGFSFALRESAGRIVQSFRKIARNFGQKASILSCKKLGKGIRLVGTRQEECCSGPREFSSNLLKALLDPEYHTQTHRPKISSSSMKEHACRNYLCPSHQAARILAPHIPDMGFLCIPSDREMHGPEVFGVALGMAMGMVIVAGSRTSEVAELHKLLQDTNSMVHQLKQQMDSSLRQDPCKVHSNEELLTKTGMDDEASLLKTHSEPDNNSCGASGDDNSSLELFRAHNGGDPSILPLNHTHGLIELEEELEAELLLMERNVGNDDTFGWETKHISFDETNEVHQVDGELYMDKKDFESDLFDLIPAQVVDQFCESDYSVPPLELERRLWQVLEQRQEERISELENDLNSKQQTLATQAEEIQWWKDRVWWLMETSLGPAFGIP